MLSLLKQDTIKYRELQSETESYGLYCLIKNVAKIEGIQASSIRLEWHKYAQTNAQIGQILPLGEFLERFDQYVAAIEDADGIVIPDTENLQQLFTALHPSRYLTVTESVAAKGIRNCRYGKVKKKPLTFTNIPKYFNKKK